ncbi:MULTISPECIES: DUF523 domain-containing protein [Fusobacterium]|uniref:DUF523 domain-containing protein n=1 Tax=Fusobacterium TaxID=848 RepID=UPI000C6FDEBD|nr:MULTISPECIES: DUF523 domain-containing protein [Fusobacterium]
MNILVSACLLGVCCRYDGQSKSNHNILNLIKTHNLIPICPEQLGGLETPRLPAEIQNDKVIRKDGKDVTFEYNKGATEALKIAKLFDCKIAILKEKSPSCGYKEVYDGSFSKKLIPKQGVTALLLEKNGIKVIGENSLEFLK